MALSDGFRVVAAAGCLVALAGCSSADFSERGGVRNVIGLTANAPDEFLVVSKAPLVMPPDMNLRPPRAGQAPIGESDPRAVARTSLTGTDGASVAGAGGSAGEQAILARANATTADSAAREELLAEQGVVVRDQPVLDRILGREETGTAIEPYSEAERLRRQQAAAGTHPAQAGTAQAQAGTVQAQASGKPTSILLEDILGGGTAAR